ncbi:MAG: hypothetical protein LBR77_11660 [Lachnospiraceae bacterium]|jgi:ABC-type transport system involved in multi-copper enzyme maturation permease subunit|nr:hypothetical protein [Lachnospiraceae bacterium]
MIQLRANPVYKRETLTAFRGWRLPGALFGVNGCLALFALLNMYGAITQMRMAAQIRYTAFMELFLFAAVYEFLLATVYMPAGCAGAVGSEREAKTLQLLLSTRLSAWDIVLGKLCARLSDMGLFLVSGFPIFALSFVYGGIYLTDICVFVACMASYALLLGSVALFFSCLLRRAWACVVASYGAAVALLGGTLGIHILSKLFFDEAGAYLLLLLNPVATFYIAVGARLGASPLFGSLLALPQTGGYVFLTNHFTAVSLAVQVAVSFAVLGWAAAALGRAGGE